MSPWLWPICPAYRRLRRGYLAVHRYGNIQAAYSSEDFWKKEIIFQGSFCCKILDLSFGHCRIKSQLAIHHLGGEFGERIDVVKDASFARAGVAGAVHP